MVGMAPDKLKLAWVASASAALWQIPTSRLRYVIVTMRELAERTDVGVRFVLDDHVTLDDRELSSECETEMISDFAPDRVGALDLSPVALPAHEVPHLGEDDFVLYARAGEVDPRGSDWTWGPLASLQTSEVVRLGVAVSLALRGCVESGLRRVLVGFAQGRAVARLAWLESPGFEATALERILAGRLEELVPDLGAVDVHSVTHDLAEANDLVTRANWLNVFIAGPAPWLD